jgi:hypothetical protein
MLCQNVRQILARSSDQPTLVNHPDVRAHLQICAECRREEFYFKQLANVPNLVFPYEVSPNFNYKLGVKLANQPVLEPLSARPGIRRRAGWYVSMGLTGVFAALAMVAVSSLNHSTNQPVPVASTDTEVTVPVPPPQYTLPIPIFGEIAHASERSAFNFTPESPIAAQYAAASSEPVRPGVDGEAVLSWEESWVWVGDAENGYFVPVRRYNQATPSSEPALLLPAASTVQNVNIVY